MVNLRREEDGTPTKCYLVGDIVDILFRIRKIIRIYEIIRSEKTKNIKWHSGKVNPKHKIHQEQEMKERRVQNVSTYGCKMNNINEIENIIKFKTTVVQVPQMSCSRAHSRNKIQIKTEINTIKVHLLLVGNHHK